MTTNVVVKTWEGAGWDVEVIAVDYKYPRGPRDLSVGHTVQAVVKPGGEYTAYATDTRDILVREIKHS